MISSVTFENYRGFTRYTLDGLSRVNLLVGMNNCGKTAILEGIHFLVSNGNPAVLVDIVKNRGEVVLPEVNETFSMDPREGIYVDPYLTYPTVIHFFNGHVIELGTSLSINADSETHRVTVNIVNPIIDEINGQLTIFAEEDEMATWALKIITNSLAAEASFLLPISDEGVLPLKIGKAFRRKMIRFSEMASSLPEIPVEFVSPNSLEPNSLARMWDKVTKEGRESEVINALQLLEPRLTDIRFLTGMGRMPGLLAGILVELEHRRNERVPLGSYGDGMRRLLALSIAIIQCTDGVLLIDEIDTGLHYSVMGDLWRFIVEAAKQSNVQVFATTHSLDCIRGLAELYRQHPEYADDISLQRIVPKLEKSVAFNARNIEIAMHQNVEVR